MAKVKFNPIIEEVSGAFGDIVFRELRGKTILSRKPTQNGEVSEDQAAHRDRFREAVAYGKTVMADADIRALYNAAADNKNTPMFALTVADFFNAPAINNVDLSAYNGQVGNVIKVRATDDFGVMSVHIALTNGDGNTAIESGNALETAPGSGEWLYTATTAVSTETNVIFDIVATDRPGGTAVSVQTKLL